MPSPPANPYPADEWADYGGLTMHCRNWGGAGQPLVLLHGLASTCRIWDLAAPILAQDFAVVAVDQRGHGDTAKPPHGYDFATVAHDVAAMLQTRGLDHPILAGHSWGADVALELAVAQPKLPRGLIFVDGGTIDASARYPTLHDALTQMAPPDFSGVTPAAFLRRIRESGGQWADLLDHLGQPAQDIILANFDTLPDGTLSSKLSRENHLRIIEAPLAAPPPGTLPPSNLPRPANARPPASQPRRLRAPPGPRPIHRRRRKPAAPQRHGLARGQHPRRPRAAPATGRRNHPPAPRQRVFQLTPVAQPCRFTD